MSDESPFESVKWGSFSKQFKRRPEHLRHLHNLHDFANYILHHIDEFNTRTERRARFYLNLINPKGGALKVKVFKDMIENSYKHDKTQIGGFNIQPISTREVQVWVDFYTRHLVIVFTGTYTALDWLNNYEMAKGNYQSTRRFKTAKRIFEESLSQFPDFKVTLLGHSQAGMIVHLLNDPRVYEALSYNPAFFPTTRQKSNEFIVKTTADPVSIMVRPNEKNTIIKSKTSNPLREHSTIPLEQLDQNKLIGKGLNTYKNKFNKTHGFPKDTSHSIEDIAKLSGYELEGLKTIFDKGIGAYHTNRASVRPNVKSPEQWGMSRLYASINPKSKASKVDAPHLVKV
jgi:hypothetical protein